MIMEKKVKSIVLYLEYGIRILSYFYGFCISCMLFYAHLSSLKLVEKMLENDNQFTKEILTNNHIVLLISTSIFPILVAIFFLIATRKFKEINQLIEENKKT
jgi:hypothetical protein